MYINPSEFKSCVPYLGYMANVGEMLTICTL